MVDKALQFKEFLLNQLTAAQYARLHEHLGVTPYRISWLLNDQQNRLDRFTVDELLKLATLLNLGPEVLVAEYGIASRELTVAEANELVENKNLKIAFIKRS